MPVTICRTPTQVEVYLKLENYLKSVYCEVLTELIFNMSLMQINVKHLNQTHLLRQAIAICAEGQCNEIDILHRLLLLLDLYDINLDVVKCERSAYDLSDPMTWIHILAVGIVVSHVMASVIRQCKRLFTRRRLPGKIKLFFCVCDEAARSSRSTIISFVPASLQIIFCTL